ncbi:MAG: hypothetical protein JNM28_01295 [Armatimonadetes bacterium]|nr:hypothetical protein [Armatimonadota bacterium]MBS1711057.1 hypothetical protein [Armatimonadota bacterium]MBX3108729.1 hypothetical protein [Fimbriimonadaceae bacterium]
MQLPANPFPEPHTVPGCVDSRTYGEKIRFIKAALVGHLLTVLAVAFCAVQIHLPLTDSELLVWLGVIFAAMTGVRLGMKTGVHESWFSFALLMAAVPLLGQLGRDIHAAGYPVIILLGSAAFAGVYTLLAGRDFSFPGMVACGSVALIPALAILTRTDVLDPGSAPFAWILGTAYLGYVAYDLAMILKRRKVDEIPSAIADFYRDSLNFLTYPFRVARHWQTYEFH